MPVIDGTDTLQYPATDLLNLSIPVGMLAGISNLKVSGSLAEEVSVGFLPQEDRR